MRSQESITVVASNNILHFIIVNGRRRAKHSAPHVCTELTYKINTNYILIAAKLVDMVHVAGVIIQNNNRRRATKECASRPKLAYKM